MASSGQRSDDGHDNEFMSTLARGLAVPSAFGKQRPAMTLSDAAAVANLSRATARRVLRTLAQQAPPNFRAVKIAELSAPSDV